jgi:hypothetical protein
MNLSGQVLQELKKKTEYIIFIAAVLNAYIHKWDYLKKN